MNGKQLTSIMAFSVILTACANRAAGDTFGSGEDTFEIDFVTVGDPGNAHGTDVLYGRPTGGVSYEFRVGKYEVATHMISKANAVGGLGIVHHGDASIPAMWRFEPSRPAYQLSWFGAATFVNWLNESTNNVPAYKFDSGGNFQLWEPSDPGYDPQNLYRNGLTRYVLPDVDEWYKAAFYDGENEVYYDYPTGSNDPPDGIDFEGDTVFDMVFNGGFEHPRPNDYTNAGIESPYGTVGQGGNVWEWDETSYDYLNNDPNEGRAIRGGDWDVSNSTNTPNSAYYTGKWHRNGAADPLTRTGIGLRVASLFVPEPGDFDIDGDTDGADFLKWQQGFPSYDYTDLANWTGSYGGGSSLLASSATVPEPTTCGLALAALGSLSTVLRKPH